MGSRSVGDYQLHILGYDGVPSGLPEGASVVVVPSDAHDVSSWVEALSGSGLTGADLRTHLLIHPDPHDSVAAVLFATAMAGFAGRVPDMAIGAAVLNSSAVYRSVAAFRSESKPVEPVRAVVSGDLTVEGAIYVDFSQPFPPELVAELRHAKHGVLASDGRSSVEMLTSLVVLSGLRELRRKPRFPWFLSADFSMSSEHGDLRPTPPENSYDLEALRRSAGAVRRVARIDVRDAVVDAGSLPPRAVRLSSAAASDMAVVLAALGAEQVGLVWRCPRPDRHTNGDRDPSAELTDKGFLCHRCDVEPVDALRLVSDVLVLSPDEACDWLEAATCVTSA